ncbi:D-box splicing factor-binding site containing protein, putative [Babesia ovis]|uniref:D-box splicing factor-binding site containing protein, putative n=1 Tax=Babesia ovis TaxID=5869 RepID=A0A9W5WWL2_BABOV|nr:D-box splicing factor-binding site containing protein, putative [Babesia ovis]
MKISFGISKAENKQPTVARAAVPAASQFFEAEAPTAPAVKRVKVTEIANGHMQVITGGKAVTVPLVESTSGGHSVIPCTNRLDDITVHAKDGRSTVKHEPVELKYGLNVLPGTKTRASRQSDVADNREVGPLTSGIAPGSHGTLGIQQSQEGSMGEVQSVVVGETGNQMEPIISNGTGEPTVSDGTGQTTVLDDPGEPTMSNSAVTTSDADVAKLILQDLEKQKLKDKLFGTDLVEQASKTVPILLRGKNKRERESAASNEKPSDAPEYDKVSVDEFGLAMLLGMGFDPSKNTNKPKEYKRRAYDRAGLGADAHMKHNMETLTNAGMMAKLKKDQMYHHAHSDSTTWLLPGLYVRVVERDHPYFGKKGVVLQVGNKATLDIDGKPLEVSLKALETVVSLDATKCKVVRQIARHSEKFYVPVGTVVQIESVTKTYAKVMFRDSTFTVSLDDICEFR